MAETVTDELTRPTRPSPATACSRPSRREARALIEPLRRDRSSSQPGETVLSRGDQVSMQACFPFGPTMISMAVELTGGRSVEVASIGREGAVGGIVSCGHAPAFARADVLVGGPAFGCR